MRKEWIDINNLSIGQCSVNKNIRFKTSMLLSNLYDYRDSYIVVKRIVNVRVTANNDKDEKNVAFKINAPFRSCITKINRTLIGNAEDLDIVIPM